MEEAYYNRREEKNETKKKDYSSFFFFFQHEHGYCRENSKKERTSYACLFTYRFNLRTIKQDETKMMQRICRFFRK